MIREFAFAVLLVAGVTCFASAQQNFELPRSTGYAPTQQTSAAYNAWFSGPGAYEPSTGYEPSSAYESYAQPTEPNPVYSPSTWVQEAKNESGAEGGAAGAGGEAAGGAEGGGGQAAGAGAAVNPGVPLAQFQFQNSFIPESYGGSGYSNTFVVQPVIPISLKPGRYFEYHIVRPTLSILSPVSDPDGPIGDASGIGDLVALDLYFHTIEKGLIWGIGPVYSFPASTNRQTGLGEWQLGPSIAVIDSRKKGWVSGLLVQAPISLESDAYSVILQPVLTKLLKNEWYAGWGDLSMTVAGNNNAYNLPLSMRVGKVIKAGKQPINIFVQPQYTPDGFHSGPTAEWGVKLSVSFLLPGAEFGYSKEKAEKRACRRGCHGVCYCN